jgi:Uncharacterized protein encoded in hypervariable junctions of pilus gene clusters
MTEEMKKKLAAIETVEPDGEDIRIIAEAEAINDDSAMSLEAFQESLEGFGGKILLRVPKSLHKRLATEARMEGVSLNQYALYKLSR